MLVLRLFAIQYVVASTAITTIGPIVAKTSWA